MNNAKLREALIDAKGWLIKCLDGDNCPTEDDIRHAIDGIESALAEPVKNCDVGTPTQQYERYCNFTGRYNPCSYKGYVRCAEDCPVHTKLAQEGHGELLCQLEWAQMPYEEGGAK